MQTPHSDGAKSPRAHSLANDDIPPGLVLLEAKSFMARLRGLIARKIPKRHGVLFRCSYSLHTCFMSTAIDVLYLDANGRVIHIVRNLKPWRLSICNKAAHFIEIPSYDHYPAHLGQTFPLTHLQEFFS